VVKLETEAASVDELRDLVIAAPMGKPIRIRDVANVVDGPAEARSVASPSSVAIPPASKVSSSTSSFTRS